jgi:hypothetical protein
MSDIVHGRRSNQAVIIGFGDGHAKQTPTAAMAGSVPIAQSYWCLNPQYPITTGPCGASY